MGGGWGRGELEGGEIKIKLKRKSNAGYFGLFIINTIISPTVYCLFVVALVTVSLGPTSAHCSL